MNIGDTLSKRLASIEIYSRSDLELVGPVRAYIRMSELAGKRLPMCYNLYSLQGALNGKDWRELSNAEKQKLRSQVAL
ncbi:MAG: TfoX/Sxy family DNA transformation protein [Henriciella sp.]|nr:TfoX/Sxy family DNA transformation protein [Henriciella sp.]